MTSPNMRRGLGIMNLVHGLCDENVAEQGGQGSQGAAVAGGSKQ
jgi:hypothetical protein